MTETTLAPAATPAGRGRFAARRLIAGLALTQTVGYGVMYYAFAVLLTPIATALHTSTAAVAGALTTSIVVAAGAAIPLGRWLDHRGGRGLMTAGSTLGVIAVVGWSQVQQVWQLYAVFVLIGLASAASLYEAAFPVVIAAARPGQRDRDVLSVTIIAGFASSIFLPLTGLLLAQLGWRTTLLVLGGLLAVVAIPAHAVLVPKAQRREVGHHCTVDASTTREALRDSTFWLLAGAFVAQAAAVSAVGVLLVTYLRQAGHGATVAATVAGLLGVMSVTGRLVTTGAARRVGMTTVAAVVFAVQAVGVLTLPYVSRSLAGASLCVVAFGIGFGVATIARPAIVADRYGTSRYATIAASMAMPITLARAFAPIGAAAIAPNAFLTTAGVMCLASAALLWTTRTRRSPGEISVE
jgi:predicted MFS family arabinose efflux permease